MAQKMAKEIFEAERAAEQIIADAEKAALKIQEDAKRKAAEKSEEILLSAHKKAEEIIKTAELGAVKENQNAKTEAEKLCGSLDEAYSLNRKKAIPAAAEILLS